MRRIKRPIYVDGVVANRVQADSFGARRRICNEDVATRIEIMESLQSPFACVGIITTARLNAAVDVGRAEIREQIGNSFDSLCESTPKHHMLAAAYVAPREFARSSNLRA